MFDNLTKIDLGRSSAYKDSILLEYVYLQEGILPAIDLQNKYFHERYSKALDENTFIKSYIKIHDSLLQPATTYTKEELTEILNLLNSNDKGCARLAVGLLKFAHKDYMYLYYRIAGHIFYNPHLQDTHLRIVKIFLDPSICMTPSFGLINIFELFFSFNLDKKLCKKIKKRFPSQVENIEYAIKNSTIRRNLYGPS